MLALRVSINGAAPVVCGADDLAVLTASVTASGPLGPKTFDQHSRVAPDIYVRAGGLTSRPEGQADEHLGWMRHRELRVGDVVTIEVVSDDSPSEVVDRRPAKERA